MGQKYEADKFIAEGQRMMAIIYGSPAGALVMRVVLEGFPAHDLLAQAIVSSLSIILFMRMMLSSNVIMDVRDKKIALAETKGSH